MKVNGFVIRAITISLAVSANAQSENEQPQKAILHSASNEYTAVNTANSGGQKPSVPADYVLGPGDLISVRVLNAEEINDKAVQIGSDGSIRIPVAGRIAAGGLTTTGLEAEITARLKRYILRPDVSVSVTEFRSQPVSILGAVKNPGMHQVQSGKTLYEMLSLAGGLDTNAGSTIKITRKLEWGSLPLPGAVTDQTGQFSVAEVSVKSILEAKNPGENILVRPYDVISIPRADSVYVIGQVLKSGGITLNDRERVTVLQALSIAGGLDRAAKPQNAKILRKTPEGESRTEIAVNLNKILEGKLSDIPMQPEDILFVPSSVSKQATVRALEAAVQAATGLAIWRVP